MDNYVLKQSAHDELYAELYQRYAMALFAYAFQRLSSREDAEDIVLEVFVSVLNNARFPGFDAKKQEAWLWAILRNKLVDHYRYEIRRPQVSIDWLVEPLYAEVEGSPEQISLQHEEYARLTSTVEKLPKLQQDVLRLRFVYGLKCDEISLVLEKSGSAVRMLLTRTLRQLRGLYKEQAEGGQR